MLELKSLLYLKKRYFAYRYFYAFFGPLIFLSVWGIVSTLGIIDSFFLPSPVKTISSFFHLMGSDGLWRDLLTSLDRTVVSFLIASLLGVPLGLLLGNMKNVYRSLEFIIDFFRSLPSLAIFPLFLILFGIGDISKIAVATFGSFLIILFNTAYGVMHA